MKEILDGAMMKRSMVRMAHEIVERNRGCENIVIVGIKTKGVPIGKRLCEMISSFEGVDVPFTQLDISLWRDDKKKASAIEKEDLAVDVHDKKVILVDDVLYRGRTVRAAMDAIMDYGRASEIQLAVLVDRGHRQLPIRADFVGKNVPTSEEESVIVHTVELDGEDAVYIKRSNE